MDDKIKRAIGNLTDWKAIKNYENNARRLDQLTSEVAAALQVRSTELGREYIAEKTGLDLSNLTPVKNAIVNAIGEYAGIMRRQGKHPRRTLDQLKNRGLIGAAEAAVCRAKPTQGYQALADEGLENLSYEQIIVDHPEEFSDRAIWYARRTLNLPNEGSVPPPEEHKERGKKTRNPSWTRDELILTLELYLLNRESVPNKDHDEVRELSELLNRLGEALGIIESDKFRNVNGVYMKLMNFRAIDPLYEGKGLERGGKLEKEVWDEFSGDLERLKSVSNVIRDNVEQGTVTSDVDLDDEEEAEEGRYLTRVHRSRERSGELVKKKKAQFKGKHGTVFCEACGHDFGKVYGSRGAGFIECHHTKPVSELEPGSKTKLSELVLVCSNCHRMIHRMRPWLTLDELKRLMQK